MSNYDSFKYLIWITQANISDIDSVSDPKLHRKKYTRQGKIGPTCNMDQIKEWIVNLPISLQNLTAEGTCELNGHFCCRRFLISYLIHIFKIWLTSWKLFQFGYMEQLVFSYCSNYTWIRNGLTGRKLAQRDRLPLWWHGEMVVFSWRCLPTKLIHLNMWKSMEMSQERHAGPHAYLIMPISIIKSSFLFTHVSQSFIKLSYYIQIIIFGDLYDSYDGIDSLL